MNNDAWVLKFWLSVLAIAFGLWIWNAVKFVSCDFETNYKCEIIHGAGVFVPPASLLTVWFDGDSL